MGLSPQYSVETFCQDNQQSPCTIPLLLTYSACEQHFNLLILPSLNILFILLSGHQKLSFCLTRHSISSLLLIFLLFSISACWKVPELCFVFLQSAFLSIFISCMIALSHSFKYLLNMRMISEFVYLGVLSSFFPS